MAAEKEGAGACAPSPRATTTTTTTARAEALAALLCSIIDDSTAAAATSISSSSDHDSTGGAKSLCASPLRRRQLTSSESGGGGGRRPAHPHRDALEDSFTFLLSTLSVGAGKDAALRRWLQRGAGALPFSSPVVDDVGSGSVVCSARPFSIISSSAAVEEGDDAAAGEFIALWALNAARTQEAALLHRCGFPGASRHCKSEKNDDEEGEEGVECAVCEGGQLCRWPAAAPDIAATTALRLGPLPLPLEDAQQLPSVPVDAAAERGSGGEEAALVRQLARGLLHAGGGVPAISIRELPPLAVAYALIESPSRRWEALLSPLLQESAAVTRAATPTKTEGKEGELPPTAPSSSSSSSSSSSAASVFLAKFPAGHGVRRLYGGEAGGWRRLPRGFEQILHEGFTSRLLLLPPADGEGPDTSRRTPPPPTAATETGGPHTIGSTNSTAASEGIVAASFLPRYRALRQHGSYGGVTTAAAALIAAELQRAACTWWQQQRGDSQDHMSRAAAQPIVKAEPHSESETAAAGEGGALLHTPNTAGGIPLAAALGALVRAGGGSKGGAPASRGLEEVGRLWTLLLGALAVSDNGPGQYVRGVLDAAAAAAACGATGEEGGTDGDSDDDDGSLSFPPSLFQQTLEELSDYGVKDTVGDSDVRFVDLLHLPEEEEEDDGGNAGRGRARVRAGVLSSPAVLVATALRHPHSISFQLQQISCTATAIARAAIQARPPPPPPTHRRRAVEEDAAAVRRQWGADLAARVHNLLGVFAYSAAAGLLPRPTISASSRHHHHDDRHHHDNTAALPPLPTTPTPTIPRASVAHADGGADGVRDLSVHPSLPVKREQRSSHADREEEEMKRKEEDGGEDDAPLLPPAPLQPQPQSEPQPQRRRLTLKLRVAVPPATTATTTTTTATATAAVIDDHDDEALLLGRVGDSDSKSGHPPPVVSPPITTTTTITATEATAAAATVETAAPPPPPPPPQQQQPNRPQETPPPIPAEVLRVCRGGFTVHTTAAAAVGTHAGAALALGMEGGHRDHSDTRKRHRERDEAHSLVERQEQQQQEQHRYPPLEELLVDAILQFASEVARNIDHVGDIIAPPPPPDGGAAGRLVIALKVPPHVKALTALLNALEDVVAFSSSPSTNPSSSHAATGAAMGAEDGEAERAPTAPSARLAADICAGVFGAVVRHHVRAVLSLPAPTVARLRGLTAVLSSLSKARRLQQHADLFAVPALSAEVPLSVVLDRAVQCISRQAHRRERGEGEKGKEREASTAEPGQPRRALVLSLGTRKVGGAAAPPPVQLQQQHQQQQEQHQQSAGTSATEAAAKALEEAMRSLHMI